MFLNSILTSDKRSESIPWSPNLTIFVLLVLEYLDFSENWEKKYLLPCKVYYAVKFLGASKVSPGNRITLGVDVVKEIKIKVGEKVVFERDEKGNVIIRKG